MHHTIYIMMIPTFYYLLGVVRSTIVSACNGHVRVRSRNWLDFDWSNENDARAICNRQFQSVNIRISRNISIFEISLLEHVMFYWGATEVVAFSDLTTRRQQRKNFGHAQRRHLISIQERSVEGDKLFDDSCLILSSRCG